MIGHQKIGRVFQVYRMNGYFRVPDSGYVLSTPLHLCYLLRDSFAWTTPILLSWPKIREPTPFLNSIYGLPLDTWVYYILHSLFRLFYDPNPKSIYLALGIVYIPFLEIHFLIFPLGLITSFCDVLFSVHP